MTYYIFPNQVDSFSKKFHNATKHLAVKPEISFSEPMKKKQTTVEIINNGWGMNGDGVGGYYRTSKYLELVEVTIGDIEENDWVLVANVRYTEGILELVNSSLFKSIPAGYGLEYAKCDYCGGVHSGRSLSHIIFNKKENKWMQVGSTCIGKMIGDTYLTKFSVQLSKIIETTFASADYEMMFSGGYSTINHYMGEAICFEDILTAVAEYRKENPIWIKKAYPQKGTTDMLNEWLDTHFVAKNDAYVAKVCDYIKALPESEFVNSIKSAISDEYIARCDIYKAFYAVKMYENSIDTRFDNYKSGDAVTLESATLVSSYVVESYYYGIYYDFVFTANGIKYIKSASNNDAFDKYKNEDGTYSFTAIVKCVDMKREAVILSGRTKKCNN